VVSAGSAAVRALSGARVWFYCRVCAPGLVSVALFGCGAGTTQLLYSEGVGAEALHVCFENYYNCFDAVCKVVMFVLHEQ
jgi:hypothetical protein